IKLLKMLGNLKISILGCGGGGSHIALQLAQLGVGRIHLVDYDIVEETISTDNPCSHLTMSEITKLIV
ncbi:ThiF family adenylyltransferase, partial [Streptococcus equi]|uniref:ThiF family adenylyltransferase n=1 Tax=Streptococcus equi TaxID=1336 RepID=UPI002032BBBE